MQTHSIVSSAGLLILDSYPFSFLHHSFFFLSILLPPKALFLYTYQKKKTKDEEEEEAEEERLITHGSPALLQFSAILKS